MKNFTILLFLLSISLSFAQTVELNQIASSFNSITEIVNAGDDRLFIVEQPGEIIVLNPDSSRSTFLDIRSIVLDGGERGLLGLAFAPDYTTSGRFYVNYINNSGDTVIARYTVSSNPDVANTNGTILLTIGQPFSNHNGGKILFGPDGYLYIGMGDGGSGGDPQNLSQNTNTLLGKLLRIDVSGATYTNPPGNPYLNGGGLPEIYAIGLRNPWRMSIDSVTNDLFIADVGQNAFEEVNVVDYTVPGLNYGWRCYEGLAPFNSNGGTCPPISGTVQPVEVQSHSSDGVCSITGGYVYRGSMYPNFVGKYFYGDICSQEIGILTNNAGTWSAAYQTPNISFGYRTFGEDNNGELYVASSSRIYQLTDPNLSIEDELTNTASFKLYPNPSENGSVSLDFTTYTSAISEISVYSIQGKRVQTITSVPDDIFNLSTKNLSSGFYIVKVTDVLGNSSQKKLVVN